MENFARKLLMQRGMLPQRNSL